MANRTLPEGLRDNRLDISVLIEQIQNGSQALALTTVTALKADIDAAFSAISSATDATITTL
jgi:hypothetical protein